MRRGPRRRGFSLVELVVVVAILGAFAVMAAPSYQRATEQARADAAAGHLQAIWAAERTWRLDHDHQYADLATLAAAGLVDATLPAAAQPYTYEVRLDEGGARFVATATRTGSGAWRGTLAIDDESGAVAGELTGAGAVPLRPGFQFGER